MSNTKNVKALLIVTLLALAAGTEIFSGTVAVRTDFSVQELRCEYLSNPLGIDVLKPRLSWILNPAEEVSGQSAYRILVASTPEIPQKNQGDLWDSGRIASTQNTWVEYGGKSLGSGQRISA